MQRHFACQLWRVIIVSRVPYNKSNLLITREGDKLSARRKKLLAYRSCSIIASLLVMLFIGTVLPLYKFRNSKIHFLSNILKTENLCDNNKTAEINQ